jgi:Ca2+-dependent lipid-binding protein
MADQVRLSYVQLSLCTNRSHNPNAVGRLVDSYVTLAFARLGKPLFSTRVVSGRSPIWEETAVVLVGPEAIGVREKLSFQIWDSDRVSADDVLGTVEIDVASEYW